MSTSSILLDTSDPDYTDDAVLALPSKVDWALCSACRKLKRIRLFRRYASLSQTRAWLRNPLATQRLKYEGRECNRCFGLTTRKAHDMSPAELERRLHNEETHPLFLINAVSDRKAEGKRKQKENMMRSNRIRFAEKYEQAFKKLESFRQAIYRVRKSPKLDTMAGMIPTLAEFLDNADSIVFLAKQKVRDLRREGKAPPNDWRKLVPDKSRAYAEAIYKKLPVQYRHITRKVMSCIPAPIYVVPNAVPPGLLFKTKDIEAPLDLSWLEEMMQGKSGT
jgi:hypothetical protein